MKKLAELKLIHFLQIALLSVTFLLTGCSGAKKASVDKRPIYKQLIEESPVFNQAFTGFMLYDPATNTSLYQKNEQRYFTPASNTKIFTLFTSLQILGDSIPSIRYREKGDSLIFWGTGDPSLRNPYLTKNNRLIDFLKKSDKQLFYHPVNFRDTRFGAGWSWDDYYYYYQPEKSAMPFHGNVIKVDKTKDDPYFRVEPAYFSSSFSANDKLQSRYLKRVADYNIFEYNPAIQKRSYQNEHPFLSSNELLLSLLQDEVQKTITITTDTSLHIADTQVLYSAHVDTLYRQMMQASDNFIAEQLLLVCSNVLFDELNTDRVIDYALDSLMQDFPDEPIWKDGSGLSRYNLFTPRTIIHILEQLYQTVPRERLFPIMAAGGESGTIKKWYAGKEAPYVYAKTGTLSNNHCLSGFVITKSGKTLIFSFMHNNYKGGSTPYKEEMQRVLEAIHLNF